MDFCRELRELENSLEECQDKIGNLKEPCDDGKVNAIITYIKSKFDMLQLSDSSLRKMNLFLVLNSDLIVRDLLLHDFDYGHLVNDGLCINGELLVRIVSGLSLQKYFCESIVLCPPVLSIELLVFAVKAINSLKFCDSVSISLDLAAAIYKKINRIESFQETTDRTYVQHLYSKMYTYFVTLVDFCLKINSKESADDPVAIGQRIINILKLLNLCLRVYLEKDRIHSFEEYKITLQYDGEADLPASSNIRHLEFINHLVSMFIQATKELTIGLWCDLSDIFYDDSVDSEKSYQQMIGENCYMCLKLLQELNDQNVKEKPTEINALLTFLPGCSIKPWDEDDEIKSASLILILSNIRDESKSQDKWLMAMLKYNSPTPILLKDDCLRCLEQNTSVVKYDQVDIVLDQIMSAIKSGDTSVDVDRLRKLAMTSIKHFSLEDQVKLIAAYFDKYGANTCLLTSHFNGTLTEVMNKAICIAESGKQEFFAEFVELFFQSPRALLQRLFSQGLTNGSQASVVVDILKVLQPACRWHTTDEEGRREKNDLIASMLIELVEEQAWGEQEQDNLVQLVTSLASSSVIEKRVVLEDCLFPAIYRSLVNCQWDILTLFLQTVQQIVPTTSDCNIPALFVLLGQVLTSSRCDLNSFHPQAVLVCEESSVLISVILTQLHTEDVNKDTILWLESKLAYLMPLNKSYFRKLFNEEENKNVSKISCDDILLDLMHSKTTNSNTLESLRNIEGKRVLILQSLVKMLPSLSAREWRCLHHLEAIACDDSEDPVVWLFHVVADALMIIGSVVDQEFANQDSAITCLNYCIRNFAAFTQERMLPVSSVMQSATVKSVFRKSLCLLERLPAVIREPCSIFCVMILVQLMTDVFAASGEGQEATVQGLCSVIAVSSVPQARVALSRKLDELCQGH